MWKKKRKKEKVTDVSDPNKNVGTAWTSQTQLKELFIKRLQENMNYMYVTNAAILNILVFSWRYHFKLWVFVSTGEYFYYLHWRVLPNVLQSKWCQDLWKPCTILFYTLCSQIIICIL